VSTVSASASALPTQSSREGWQRASLGKLLPIKYGKSLPAQLRDASGTHPVFGSSGIVGVHSAAITTGPTLIVGRKGNVGAIHFSTVPCWPIDTAYYVEAPDGHNLRYYKYLLESLNLAKLDRSTAIPGLSRDDYNAVEVSIAPPEQQDEIVAEIEKQFSRLDEAVANLKRVKANLKRYKAAILTAAVEGRLVPTEAELARNEGRSYESTKDLLEHMRGNDVQMNSASRRRQADDSQTHSSISLPDGWAWVAVEKLAKSEPNSLGAGPFGTIFKAKDFRSEGVPIIFLRHVAPLRYLNHKPGFMDVQKWEQLFKPYSVYGGELLITKLGEPPGVCATYPRGIGPAMVTPDVIKLSVDSAIALSDFVMYYFNSEPARQFATGAAFGTTRTRLTIPLFRQMPVPLPPLAEQHRIVSEVDRLLSIISDADAHVVENLLRADHLRSAVLSKALGQDVVGARITNSRVDQQMKKIKLPSLPAARKSEAEDHRQDLMKVLIGYPGGVSAEVLLQEAGYRGDQVDVFYRDLARLADQIVQVLPDTDGKSWPASGAVKIQLKG
jgi:type I restriction enzyme S subunit